ncbi:2OG-Fe(II) oxygenase [Sphingomonas sp. RRHST34]|uniref:2OG-Fe(II) oxygenase n=1 Tax=Sphingomonas citri TaxID=2862499 RepID=A0ABS7BSI7_9SPHN|nr:2OG-Fe(II) oxygenase [Sphingomonas citri]MBW6532567.1 2OG-Fe(II) oxygenase [Sphingomonas citri]
MIGSTSSHPATAPLHLSDAARAAMASSRFHDADPFPVLILDDFLPEAFAAGLHQEILALKDLSQSNDYIFAKNKFEYPTLEAIGPHGAELKRFLLSEEFGAALTAMYGRPLFVDANFTGGGVHRGGSGSFLDMHADFERHPGEKDWVRELNILLYMNKDWAPAHGGALDLKHADTGAASAIEPLYNRLVLMLTKSFTLHGYKRTSFPPGSYRNSIAAYAYSREADEGRLARLSTTTRWQPSDAGSVKRTIAALTPRLVRLKQRLLGSNTARGAGKK